MKDSNHTPGPWIATGSAIEDVDITEIRTVDERLLAEVLPYDTLDGMAEMDANARLIAAAPELLEALEHIAAWSDSRDGSAEAVDEALDRIRRWASTAIAKATGQH